MDRIGVEEVYNKNIGMGRWWECNPTISSEDVMDRDDIVEVVSLEQLQELEYSVGYVF